MTHLTREALERFRREGSPAERDRIVAHLAVCDACGALYGEVLDQEPVEPTPATAPLAAALRERGYRSYRRNAPGWWSAWWRRPATLAGAAAAAVAVALVLALPLLRESSRPAPALDQTGVRGSGVQALEPIGEAARPLRFRWSSALDAPRFELEIRDADGRVVAAVTSDREQAELAADDEARLVPGARYTWRVTALDADGEVMAVTEPRSFVVAARE